MFSGLIAKVLLCGMLTAMVVSSLTTYLYLTTRDELIEIQTQYKQLQEDLILCSESKDKIRVSAEQDDKIITQNQEQINNLVTEKDKLISALAKFPRKSCMKSNNPENNNEPSHYVDIDAPFDDEFIRVFKQQDSH